jgi:hypothetical protein
MSVRKEIDVYDGIFFITFTNARWIHLFERAQAYDSVYKWFDYLKSHGHFIIGYVIMPNHLHVIIAFRNTKGKSINNIIGTGKRFMAYEIVKGLKKTKQSNLLALLQTFVNNRDKYAGKLHEVFEPSFDWKECNNNRLIEQKLDYIHNNPCQGNWLLAEAPSNYKHSSAFFYSTGQQGCYEVLSYSYLDDVDLTKPTTEL